MSDVLRTFTSSAPALFEVPLSLPTVELVSPERWIRARPFSGRVIDPRAVPPPRFSEEGWPEDFRMPLLVLGVGGA